MKMRIALALLLPVAALFASASDVRTIDAGALQKRIESNDKPLVVDVREREEFDAGHIKDAMLVPLGTVHEGLSGVAKDREIVLVCRSGRRSAKAYGILAEQGFTNLWNLDGGMLAWEKVEKK